ncbi:hypothetical protein GCM10023142_28830 [Anaerocolumna aminovalerica]
MFLGVGYDKARPYNKYQVITTFFRKLYNKIIVKFFREPTLLPWSNSKGGKAISDCVGKF